jgi:hypothetical protein
VALDRTAQIGGGRVERGGAHDQDEIRTGTGSHSRGEREPDGLTHAPASAIPLDRAAHGTRRRDSDTHGRLIGRESAEGEQLVVARDTFGPNARDVFPSPQSRGVHHCLSRRR